MDEQRDFVNRSRVSEEHKLKSEFTQAPIFQIGARI